MCEVPRGLTEANAFALDNVDRTASSVRRVTRDVLVRLLDRRDSVVLPDPHDSPEDVVRLSFTFLNCVITLERCSVHPDLGPAIVRVDTGRVVQTELVVIRILIREQ